MCIVSLITLSEAEFILTHNRDENINRQSSNQIEKKNVNGIEIQCPVDLASEGTWIYSSDRYVCCVLNGEFERHERILPYRKSRGQVILELLKFNSIQDFVNNVNLIQIEPFTMVMVDLKTNEKKILVWDSQIKHIQDVAEGNTIVRSSSTLYSNQQKVDNLDQLKSIAKESKPLFDKHNQIKMLRNELYPNIRTTSITQVIHKKGMISMNYCQI